MVRRSLAPAPNMVWVHDYCKKHGLYVPYGDKNVKNTDCTYLVMSGWSGGRIRIVDP